MTENALLQLGFFLFILLICVKPLGWYMARVYQNKSCGLNRIFVPLEKIIYRLCGIDAAHEMSWREYMLCMLLFNAAGLLAVFLIQRLQGVLPFNPLHYTAVPVDLAFNTAASFISNTNWQAYSGESSLSYFTQMTALTVQNFFAAATGMAIMVALIRGITRTETSQIGNFWVDVCRTVLYILLPLSIILALVLVSQGVIQNLHPPQTVPLLQTSHLTTPPSAIENGNTLVAKTVQDKNTWIVNQSIAEGPAASQIAIKQIGTNGGGFFNANSAHPYENPTAVSNFFEMLAMLLIPAAFCYSFGVMVQQTRQGWIIFIAMLVLLVPLSIGVMATEQHGNPLLTALQVNQTAAPDFAGGNLEGKETRFGIANSGLWATIATATSTGAVNSMHDSYTPIGGLIPLWLIQLGEVVFGGVGCGLYSMLMLVFITVFVAGLMVGRTPEYLMKKIEPFEMKMAAITILIIPLLILTSTAVAAVTQWGISSLNNPGAHGFSEMLYAFSSMANNNGSAFSGLNANTPFWNILGGVVMLIGRFGIAIPVLAIAGSLAAKKNIPITAGTLPTYTPLFLFLLIGVVLIIGALTYFPALALGPIVEQLAL